MFELRYLSAEERAEYDQIFYDATHDSSGTALATRAFGDRVHAGLKDALAAGRKWPQWLLDDMVEDGLKRRAKSWLKHSEVVSIGDGESVITKKSARMGLLRKDEAGAHAYQQTLWRDMGTTDLLQIIRSAANRRKAEGLNISTAKRLLVLCEKHDVDTVTEALKLEGVTFEEFLRRSA